MNEMKLESYLQEEYEWFHANPELSYEEEATTAHIRAALKRAGVKLAEYPLKTGLVVEIGRGEPLVALRTDVDALPVQENTGLSYASKNTGKMHACGHDFHMAAVLGATLLLKVREAKLKGTVRIIFQPAEEAPGGARVVMDAGALAGVQAIFGIHVVPFVEKGTLGIKEGAVTASVDRFVIRFHGRGTHAAAPDAGLDPIPVASEFVLAAQTIVSRRISPFSPAVVSVTHMEAGNTWNVIPETALVEGTTRTMGAKNRALVRETLCNQAESLAKAHGMTAEIEWHEGPPATNNEAGCIAIARRVAEKRGIPAVTPPGWMAGEDFAYYQEAYKGAFILVSTGDTVANHNPKFHADEEAILPTAEYLADLMEEALRAL